MNQLQYKLVRGAWLVTKIDNLQVLRWTFSQEILSSLNYTQIYLENTIFNTSQPHPTLNGKIYHQVHAIESFVNCLDGYVQAIMLVRKREMW